MATTQRRRKLSSVQEDTLRYLAEPGKRFIQLWRVRGEIGRIEVSRDDRGLIGFVWTITRPTFGALLDRGYIEQQPYLLDGMGIEHYAITQAGRQAIDKKKAG